MKTTFTLPMLLALFGPIVNLSFAAETAARQNTPATATTEAGPENGGLRLKLFVAPRADAKEAAASGDQSKADQGGFDVRLELANVSNDDIKLLADWHWDSDNGDVKDYLDAAASIETYPAIAPWVGGVRVGHRTKPQPELVVKSGEVVSVAWQTTGRKLKNRVTNPQEVQNPEFPLPGLYGVHASLVAITSRGNVLLRSNEALVPVGDTHELPKFTYGQLWQANADSKEGLLSLGAVNKIEIGDEFVHLSKRDSWKITITQVQQESSIGRIEFLTFPGAAPQNNPAFPQRGDSASLTLKK